MAPSFSCPTLKDLIALGDALGVAKHANQFCYYCQRKNIQERFGGNEFLYPDKPPPWVDVGEDSAKESPSDADQKISKGKNSEENKPTKNKQLPQKAKVVIAKEEVDDYLYKRSFELSDGNLTFEIRKFKKLNKQAAHAFMIKLRQRAKIEKDGMLKSKGGGNESPALVNPRELLPWCPSPQNLFPRGVLSQLNQSEQNRFLAICQNVLNSGTFRFAHNVNDLKDFQKRADPERDHMESLVVDMTQRCLESEGVLLKNHPLGFVHQAAYDFILKRWNKRWCDANFPKCFDSVTPVCSIEWTSQVLPSSGDYFPIHVATVLKGRHDRIQLPNLRYRCRLERSKLHSEYLVDESSADDIFDDIDTVTRLCLENDVRIAMDATTACHLMANSFTGHNYSYAMPIRVIEKMIQGTITNVVVVGKPRVLGAVDPSVIQRQFIKYMLKAAYVLKRREARREASEPSHNESSEAARSKGGFCDPLDAILPALSSSSLQDGANHSASRRTYSIFSITGKNVLIRSRPAPLCSEGHQSLKGTTLSFQPKVEYVPNAGAMRLQEAEALWNYCKGIFKQSANHVLFRTHYMGNNLLQIQHWESQGFATMSAVQQLTGPVLRQDAKRILSASTTRFSRLLEEIGHLTYGDYMLVNKSDGFVKVLPRLEDDRESRDVLDCEKQNVLVAEPSVRICDAFEGLEPVVPLQWQVVQSRAPGCFVAPDSKLKLTASTVLRDGPVQSTGGGNAGVKRSRAQRKRSNAKRRRLLESEGNTPAPEPSVESGGQSDYCPFRIEPASPAPSDASSTA